MVAATSEKGAGREQGPAGKVDHKGQATSIARPAGSEHYLVTPRRKKICVVAVYSDLFRSAKVRTSCIALTCRMEAA